jgi:hypothetical protein
MNVSQEGAENLSNLSYPIPDLETIRACFGWVQNCFELNRSLCLIINHLPYPG